MIRVGSEVFVKGYKREGRRKVERFQRDIEGGVKLDRPVGLLHLWNVADLIEAGPRTDGLGWYLTETGREFLGGRRN